MFNVEGTVRLVQIEVENECQIVEGVGEECVEADTAAQHHQEVEIMARRIVSDIPVMGVVGELFIHENLMPRPKESDSHLQSIHLHDVLEPGQRHFAHGHIFVAGGRAIRITRGVSERVQDQWLTSSVVHQQSVGDVTENERRGRCVNITEGGEYQRKEQATWCGIAVPCAWYIIILIVGVADIINIVERGFRKNMEIAQVRVHELRRHGRQDEQKYELDNVSVERKN